MECSKKGIKKVMNLRIMYNSFNYFLFLFYTLFYLKFLYIFCLRSDFDKIQGKNNKIFLTRHE